MQNKRSSSSDAAKVRKKTRRGQKIRNKLQKFKVMYLNIRGMKAKFDSLLEKIDEIEPTVICITETHLLEIEEVITILLTNVFL